MLNTVCGDISCASIPIIPCHVLDLTTHKMNVWDCFSNSCIMSAAHRYNWCVFFSYASNTSSYFRSWCMHRRNGLRAVAYLGYGRHGSCHGPHFDGGAKIAWQKSKFVTCSFFNLYFAPHTTINCTAASIQRPSNAIIRACCASTKHCDKTVVL